MKLMEGKPFESKTKIWQPRRKTSIADKDFKNFLEKPSKEIINGQLDIILEQFTDKELDAVLKWMKITQKLPTLTKYLLKNWGQWNWKTHSLNYSTLSINKEV